MKCVSWNVNGIRACLNKGFMDFFKEINADIFCIQETKMQPGQAVLELAGYEQIWHSAERKGYSGTAIFTKIKPLSIQYDFGAEIHKTEGRVITLEFESFYFVNVYVPNSKRELERLDYRMEWEDAFREHLLTLNQIKPVILCGDLNVAHQEIDLRNPKSNHQNAGFTDQERAKLTTLLNNGFTDSFRYLYPDVLDAYSWWSYMFQSREKNVGWRIDYFLISNILQSKLVESVIHNQVLGSDHCPVSIEIEL